MSIPARNRGGQAILALYAVQMAALSMWLLWQDGPRLPVRRHDRGALTTEQAIITAALIGLAAALVTAIGLVVNSKMSNIK